MLGRGDTATRRSADPFFARRIDLSPIAAGGRGVGCAVQGDRPTDRRELQFACAIGTVFGSRPAFASTA